MVTKNAIGSNIPIELAKGGTNATSFSTSTGIVKYDGTSLITSSTALIDSSNRYTNTGQPCFYAYISSDQSNVTGDGTTYTVLFDTASVNVGSCYVTGTGIFTAPVTGKYLFTASLYYNGLAAGNTSMTNQLLATSHFVRFSQLNPGAMQASGELSQTVSVIIPMTAAETTYITTTVSGGTKIVGLKAVATGINHFAAYLLG
jgi:hypothetical protein